MLACVFPGQGSQSVAMLADLARAFPVVQATFEEASENLSVDLWDLSQNGPEEDLNRTENTQPALLAAGIATWRVWQAEGGSMPAYLAGHSLGEYTALVAAGSLGLVEAAALVAERGRLMQQAVPAGSGAMAAILGLDDAEVQAACEEAAEGDVVAPANLNSPGQVVIAGSAAAVERAIGKAQEKGARRAVPLAVSVPSHCALMRPAAEALGERLDVLEIRAPAIPVVHNVDAETHDDPDAIRGALKAQLYQPVRWAESVARLKTLGVERIAECGPGKVLTGLMRRIDRAIDARAVLDPESLSTAIEAWREQEDEA
ncbi:MAG: ACP S-malonyltransferase [Xanthomonadales bacterium]|nr:ACP S-malonyltransferase [Xanthomonadales bacterium]